MSNPKEVALNGNVVEVHTKARAWFAGTEYKAPADNLISLGEQAANAQSARDMFKMPAFTAMPAKERQGVMDSYNTYFDQTTIQYAIQAFPSRFVGYGFLSYLAQDAMISRGVRTLADEMTREWGELNSSEQSDKKQEQDIEAELKRISAQKVFKEAATATGFFGGCLVYIDVRDNADTPLSDDELITPLYQDGQDAYNSSKLKGKIFCGLKVIEPINIAPGSYNSTDPTSQDYFQPEYFFILGRKIHRSRFLYFADNIPPVLLKPVYMFFGIPLAQLAYPYVQEFYSCKSVSMKILQKFSLTYLLTDTQNLLDATVKERVATFAKYRDNDSVAVGDKTLEEFGQINTPLSGIKEIWYASLELIPMVFGAPATKILEISPSGFNSTGEFELRNFYDAVGTKQSNTFGEPMERLLNIICYIKGYNNTFTWTWKSLYKPTDKELADINQTKANTATLLTQIGAIGNDDVARELIADPNSGYNSLQVPERIEPRKEDEEDFIETSDAVMDADIVSDKYPNEHAARVIDPDKFEEGSFRRKNIAEGVDIILGKLKSTGKWATQTYRLKSDKFTAEQAREWLKKHNAGNYSFAAADEKKKGIFK